MKGINSNAQFASSTVSTVSHHEPDKDETLKVDDPEAVKKSSVESSSTSPAKTLIKSREGGHASIGSLLIGKLCGMNELRQLKSTIRHAYQSQGVKRQIQQIVEQFFGQDAGQKALDDHLQKLSVSNNIMSPLNALQAYEHCSNLPELIQGLLVPAFCGIPIVEKNDSDLLLVKFEPVTDRQKLMKPNEWKSSEPDTVPLDATGFIFT